MKAIERFYQYLEYKGIKSTRFEKDNGLSNGYLGTQLKRNGNLGEEILNKLVDNCLDINPTWLLTGRGSMVKIDNYAQNLNQDNNNYLQEPSSPGFKVTKKDKPIPLYNVQEATSAATIFSDENSVEFIDEITIPNLPKCDGAVYISSDSMYPLLKSGDIVIYKKVAASIENIYWGEMYLISLLNADKEEYVMVKWIQKSEKGDDFVKLVSENKFHESKDFPMDAITGLALVKASIRINATL